MSGSVALWGASSLVKSIQRGTISISSATSNTATITAVDLDASVLFYGGVTDAAGTESSIGYARVELTNATTVTGVRASTDVAATVVNYEVIEYLPGVLKSVQRGTITTGSSPTDATITEVNANKSFVSCLGAVITDATTSTALHTRIKLQNGTTVRAETDTADNQVTGYQVTEFF